MQSKVEIFGPFDMTSLEMMQFLVTLGVRLQFATAPQAVLGDKEIRQGGSGVEMEGFNPRECRPCWFDMPCSKHGVCIILYHNMTWFLVTPAFFRIPKIIYWVYKSLRIDDHASILFYIYII